MLIYGPSWCVVSTVSSSDARSVATRANARYSMLAVMAMNVGYFLSVLLGLFLGELVLGRYSRGDGGHH